MNVIRGFSGTWNDMGSLRDSTDSDYDPLALNLCCFSGYCIDARIIDRLLVTGNHSSNGFETIL